MVNKLIRMTDVRALLFITKNKIVLKGKKKTIVAHRQSMARAISNGSVAISSRHGLDEAYAKRWIFW